MKTLGRTAGLAFIFLFGSGAFAAEIPQYFKATIVPLTGTVTSRSYGEGSFTKLGCPPEETQSFGGDSGQQSFTGTLGPNNIYLLSGLQMVKRANGKWIPATATDGGITTSTLDADGIVATTRIGTVLDITYGMELRSLTVTYETLDLKSGSLSQVTTTTQYQATFNTSCKGSTVATWMIFKSRSYQYQSGTVGISLSPALFNPTLVATNPFADYVSRRVAIPTLSPSTVAAAPTATQLAADGISAVPLVFQSISADPVTFSISANVAGSPMNSPVGSLTQFDANYLKTPTPPADNSAQQVTVSSPSCDAGLCTFIALLWGPSKLPQAILPKIDIAVTATQPDAPQALHSNISLMPPPLLLVHGVWSSADQAFPTAGLDSFPLWLSARYPHDLIFRVNYGAASYQQFDSPAIQNVFLLRLENALAGAANNGMVARRVDVVAHSMGGLVTRYFMSQGPIAPVPYLPENAIHNLIAIGTPHNGSALATVLDANRDTLADSSGLVFGQIANGICTATGVFPCTLSAVMAAQGKIIGSGVQSMKPGSPQLQSLLLSNPFRAVIGVAPTFSFTETALNTLIKGFLPLSSVGSILGPAHDTIVAVDSQNPQTPGQIESFTIPGIVHANACTNLFLCPDTGETRSQTFWQQAYFWLTGGTGPAPANLTSGSNSPQVSPRAQLRADSPSAPVSSLPDLTGYTQVSNSNVTLSPASGTTLTIGSPVNITATSSTKTLIELLLFQSVKDPIDVPFLVATNSPFQIPFTPNRVGAAVFFAVSVFNDNTYSMTALNYPLQLSGTPTILSLVDAPIGSIPIGTSTIVQAVGTFATPPASLTSVDLSSVATYTVRSGSTAVFSAGTGGTITATGNGLDWLDVSFGGVTASAQILVGNCSFALSPANQIVASTGGVVTLHVTAPGGCAWIASASGNWFTLTNTTGSGNGDITLNVAANTSGATQVNSLALLGSSFSVTQPGGDCSYAPSPTQINAPAEGSSGTMAVTTSCPVVVSSNADWLNAVYADPSVYYFAAPNPGVARNAILTIGSASVPVSQAGGSIIIPSKRPGQITSQ
jgi:pimeloyl-ACP methyl ester carboxylesterase